MFIEGFNENFSPETRNPARKLSMKEIFCSRSCYVFCFVINESNSITLSSKPY